MRAAFANVLLYPVDRRHEIANQTLGYRYSVVTSPPLPSDDASSHHDEELDRYHSPTPVRSPSVSQTSRPSSPVSYIAVDGKGPGEGPV